jgi:hypothetical protein
MTQAFAPGSAVTVDSAAENAMETLTAQAKKPAKSSFVPYIVSDKTKPSIYSLEPLTAQELFSVSTIVDYVAHNQNRTLQSVCTVVATRFGVDHIARIKRRDFDAAVEFLINLRMDEMTSRR